MKVTVNMYCKNCGNDKDFSKIDSLDYWYDDSYSEYMCNCCYKRISIKVV